MDRKKIAAKIVEESIVLLKNEDGLLPFCEEKEIAFFGRAQIGTLFSGNGSGGANVAGCSTILHECEKSGMLPEPLLKGFYEYKVGTETVTESDEFDWTKVSEMVNSGIMYEIFGKYHAPLNEYEVPGTLIYQAAEKTDTAILILGRNSGGEECDRHLTEDFYLTQSEEKLLKDVCTHFKNVAVVLNVNGLIDLSWADRYPGIKSLLFLGIPGEEGAAALARVLSGKVNPSGKMAVTAALTYEDYPSAGHFSWDKENPEHILTYEDYGLSGKENGSAGFALSPVTVYKEDIYAGYRYFDTFGKKVLYPFGYGLSYTEFRISGRQIKKTENGILVSAIVRNTGKMPGKEVVQVYLAKKNPWEGLERPCQELKGFEKTKLLAPEKEQRIQILIPWRELAAYDMEKAAWVVERGDYFLRLGNSSRNTQTAGLIHVEEEILTEQCASRLGLAACNRGKINFLSQKEEADKAKNPGSEPSAWEGSVISLTEKDMLQGESTDIKSTEIKSRDTIPDKISLADLSVKELAALCVGYGPGTPFAAVGDRSDPPTIYEEDGRPLTVNNHPTGYPGYVSAAIERKGIKSVFYKDGPAGIGGLAWPTQMLIACAFDRKIWRAFGDAVGSECEEQQVNVWLAPAVNLHRSPLCGRNFEYFSEDPYLTGVCACEIAKGAQQNREVIVCPKHFAANEQETFRRGSAGRNIDAVDSVLTERALRELYLKPFEMLVRNVSVACIMTSFNKINGCLSGGSEDLCTHILREEWGFAGAVVTDWGDMDVVVDGADAVAAGNDIIMPGGPPVICQLLKGLEEGRVTRDGLEKAAGHLLLMIERIRKDRKENK